MSEPTIIKAIVTKYSLTTGPRLVAAQQCFFGRMIKAELTNGFPVYFQNEDWQPMKRDATDDVLARYMKRKAALRKAMENLDAKRDRALKMIEGMDIE